MMKKIALVLFIFFVSTAAAMAASCVWVVQGADNSTTYLGGTFHLLRQSDHPLPSEYSQAYQQSQILAFESDIGKMQSAQIQNAILQNSIYTDGTTLDKVLSPATYKKLNASCTKAGIPLDKIKHFKPVMVYLTLLSIELQKIGVSPQAGVDLHFYNKAKTSTKKIEALEPIAKQIEFLTKMGDGNEDRFIIYNLEDLDKLEQLMNAMISAWKKGDEAQIYNLIQKDMKNEFPKMYKKLIVDRNNDWMPQIRKYLKTPENEFVLVGVAHLVGPESIVALLKKEGYKVKKLQ